MILVTGGAGFIGANFILEWIARESEAIVNLDKLTYAGNLESLASVSDTGRHIFVHGDIGDRELVARVLAKHRVRAVLNFAAESHVDRSVRGAADFMNTNLVGTFNLLEAVRGYWEGLAPAEQSAFRFMHVSTDEVFGDLAHDDPPFTEATPYRPSNPYSASKAGSDHLVRAWHRTYGLPTLVSNCSNNYGPYQFPEKLIPLVIHNALAGKKLPVYGDGRQVRDWLYVGDHCSAIRRVLKAGQSGRTYNVGGKNEKANIDVVNAICTILDRVQPRADGHSYAEQIEFVRDRPGHDRRYAVDASRMRDELGWAPAETFESGLDKTIAWYLANERWIANVASGAYRDWVSTHYEGR